MKEQEVIKRLNFHKEYARLSSNRVVISETDLETVLNMLKENSAEIEQKNTELAEKNAEIEKLKKVLDEKYIFVQGARTVYGRLMSLDKEDIVKDDLALRNVIYHHIEDNEKKDKIIDLMAEAMDKIQDPQVCKYCDNKINLNHGYCTDAGKCKKGIKQYFERKSEE